ncbi:MAG: hypothetical protein VX427_04725 [Acidobacteriota bacterium]|nr:hypothetical protein [Acidobacteriota bacterium]
MTGVVRVRWVGAAADIDGDVDLGVFEGCQVRLFRNDGLPRLDNRSVRLRLRGTRSDTWAPRPP